MEVKMDKDEEEDMDEDIVDEDVDADDEEEVVEKVVKPVAKARKTRPKRTEMQPWNTEITKEDFVERLESDGRFGIGFDSVVGKYYETNTEHPAYVAKQNKKAKNKIAKKQKRKDHIAKRIEIALKKGAIVGAREYKASEKFQKRIDAAYKKGLKDGKPKVGKVERAQKKRDKAAKLLAEAKVLMGDTA